nr:hypothetical protein [uncultured Sphingomonas sp.]
MLLSPRELVEQKAAAKGLALSELSRSIGRNVAYVQQFVRRGTPRHLADRDRHTLAAILGIDHRQLIEPEQRGENDNDREDRVEGLARAMWQRLGMCLWTEASEQWRDTYRGMASFAVDWIDNHDARVDP